MNKLYITAIALVFVVLGGCANTSGRVIGTSAVSADEPYGLYMPVEPKTFWFGD